MTENKISQSFERSRRVPEICAIAAAGIALLAALGWWSDLRILAGGWGSNIPTAPSTALVFLLLSGALFCFGRWSTLRASRFFGLCAAAIGCLMGLLVLGSFMAGTDLGVEKVLSRTNELMGSTPLGRMSPITAVAFVLESASLMFLIAGRRRNASGIAGMLAAITTLLGAVVLMGYAYGVPLLYGGTIIPMALPTAAIFVLLGVGQIYLAIPSIRALDDWRSDTMRGILLRAFLPFMLFFIVFDGWLSARFEQSLDLNPALVHSLVSLAAGAISVILIGWIARRSGRELERAQETLAESEAKFRSVFENSPLGKSLTSIDGSLSVNRSFCEMLGYSEAELAKLNLRDITHPDDVIASGRVIDELLDGKIARARFEKRYLHKDGSIVWAEVTTALQRDKNGKPLYFLTVVNDITERRHVEHALHESLNVFSGFLEQSTDAVMLTDEHGVVVQWSAGAIELTGYSRDETIGQPLWDVQFRSTPEESKSERGYEKLRESLHKALITGKAPFMNRLMDTTIQHPDGRRLTVQSSAFAIETEKGFRLGGILRDMTERKRAEAALHESESRFRALIENSSDAITLLDAEGKVIYDSPSAPGMLGYGAQDWIGRDVFTLLHPDDLSNAMELFQRVAGKQGARESSTFRLQRQDGSWSWIEAVATNLVAEPGVNAIVINYHDISERKRAEAENQALLEIVQAATSTNGLDEFLESMRQSLSKVLYAENMFAVFYEKKTGMFEEVFAIDKYDPPMPPSRLEHSIVSYVYRTGEPLMLTPSKFEDLKARGEVELVGTQLASWLGAPLRTPTETIGVIAVQNYEDSDCYTERDRTFLASVASQASLAIERKQAEEKLQGERILLRTLIDNLPDRVYVLDQEGRKIVSNMADWQAAGVEKMEDVLGKTDLESYAPELAESYWKLDRQVISSGMPVINHEELGADPQGNPVLLLTSKVPLLDAHGEVRGLVGIGHDITARKQAEDAARRSEERFRSYFELGMIGIAITSPTKGWLEVNDELCNILGYDRDELLQMSWSELTHPEDLDKDVAEFNRMLAGEIDGYSLEKRWVRKDRQVIDSSISVKCLRRPDGSVDYIVALLEDITARNEAEQAKHASEEKWHRLFGILPVGVSVLDAHRAVTEMNPALEKILEMPGEALQVGAYEKRGYLRSDGTAMPLDEFPSIRAVQEQRSIEHVEIGVMTEHGAVRWTDVSAAPLPQPDGGCVVVTSDVTARKQAEERIERQVHRLSALRAVDLAISSSFDLRLSLNILLSQTINELHVDAAAVLLLNHVSNELEFAAGAGFRGSGLTGLRLKLGTGYGGQAALERRTISVPNLGEDGKGFSKSEMISGEKFVAFVAVPLVAKGQVKGVLELFHRTRLEPDPEWQDFLETLAGQAAIAIDSAQLFSELQSSNMELGLAYDSTIEGWSRAMDLRDKETEGHTQRVTEGAVKLARALGLPETEVMHLRRGALLHDMGKMGVPDSILLKPGPLTDEEWVLMRQHPALAYQMLSKVRYLQPALNVPYCHHEKWDGGGYPRGLKGEQIPLSARIFAVIDVYDALTSHRPYRPAWTSEKALDYICLESGKHFDPHVVDAFLNMVGGRRQGAGNP